MKPETIYVPRMNAYLNISKDMLPDCVFDVHGAAGPMEEAREEQKRQASLMLALQTEQVARQMGARPLNLDKIRREILRDGGWADASGFFTERVQEQAVPEGVTPISGAGGQSALA